ncbi:hypothetical protein RclHR1_09500007 [Rhizophagus clarus]|uniref:Uncharacterized protein n=1 Tax=Rhizophagus clarus TaxID=94130 RepID=A0A2Z6SQT7_9GLOM|nr:hypothetical protein RclHR1_09500007 [Rhizophagus clarus]GES98414.1 hypothetical protein GLOIN_2v1715049 [Rhizophagus clarus]
MKKMTNYSYVSFPQLQILKFQLHPNNEVLTRFLENNGKNLKELNLGEDYDSLNSSIFKFCTYLRKLSAGFKNDELGMLKIVFESCKYLKCIEIYCRGNLLSEKEALSEIVKYSHENISEIILHHYYTQSTKLLPEELESFIVSWTNYIPQRLLFLVIVTNNYCKESLEKSEENIKIINKYIVLGVIKNFKSKDYDYEEHLKGNIINI